MLKKDTSWATISSTPLPVPSLCLYYASSRLRPETDVHARSARRVGDHGARQVKNPIPIIRLHVKFSSYGFPLELQRDALDTRLTRILQIRQSDFSLDSPHVDCERRFSFVSCLCFEINFCLHSAVEKFRMR